MIDCLFCKVKQLFKKEKQKSFFSLRYEHFPNLFYESIYVCLNYLPYPIKPKSVIRVYDRLVFVPSRLVTSLAKS